VTLLIPAMLWTLAALIPLVGIYFLKVRPRRKLVTAFHLWQKIFTETRSCALFKRLRDVLSLILMALALAAVAFALAEPDLAGDERKDLLILIDHSASMNTREPGGTRLELAQQKARQIITALHGSQRAAVAAFSDEVTMKAQPTRHRRSLLDAVEALQPTHLPSRARALSTLLATSQGMKNTRLLLITDGCVDEPDQLANLELLRIGSSTGNAGIIRADLRPLPGAARRLGLFIALHSTFPQAVKADLILRHVESGRVAKLLPVDLQPGTAPPITLTLDDAEEGRWTATLELDDALPTDNTAFLHVPKREPLPVAVVAKDTFFLQSAVRAFERSDELITLVDDPAKARLALALGQTPAATSALVFQPQGQSPLWSDDETPLEQPLPRLLVKDHPLLRYLDVESLNFIGARQLQAPPGVAVLVADVTGVPLIYLVRQGAGSTAIVNLDPLAAQFYLSAWFPVLVHNAATHLGNREAEPPATAPTGSTQRIPDVPPDSPIQVQSPSGIVFTLPQPELTHLSEPGFYEITHGTARSTLACSLIAPAESAAPAANLKDSARALATGHAPSYWLLAFALGLLVSESALYHRRKLG
jgi:hypothetical protein